MSEAKPTTEMDVLPAPVIDLCQLPTIPWESDLPHPPRNKWEREYQAFLRLRPTLLEAYRDRYVAIHEGRVIESGDDLAAVATRVYAKYGPVPMYIDQVTERRRVVRIPSPRVLPRPSA